MNEMKGSIWDVFQKETGINYYFYEQKSEKNYFRVFEPSLLNEKMQGKSLDKGITACFNFSELIKEPIENVTGIFVCKNVLFDNSGKYIGAPYFHFIADMLSFERDNCGEFLDFPRIVLNHKFEGEETNWYEQFQKEFFPFEKKGG